jgi:hypothetical protein
MKKVLLLVLVAFVAAFAVTEDVLIINTVKLSFANETAAKLDTLQTLDSMFCVIDMLHDGKLPETITLHLPSGLAASDSCAVFLQLLPNEEKKGAAPNFNISPNSGVSDRYRRAENTRISGTTGTDVFKSLSLGDYSYTKQPLSITWSPKDSAVATRAQIVLVERGGAPVITGIDSLATSNVWLTKTIKK